MLEPVAANAEIQRAARRPGNAVSSMPLLDVDINRSRCHGYAAVDNKPHT
jgi:NAD(P) transhydrogenase subunit beta